MNAVVDPGHRDRVVDPKRGGKIIRFTRPVGAAYTSSETVALPAGLESIAEALKVLSD